MRIIFLCAIFLFFTLTSCSLLSPVKGHEHSYVLSSVGYPPVRHRSSISLFVAPIDSNPIYNTNQIAYTIKPYQISYFSKNGWIEPPGQMLQPLLLQTLQNTHYFRVVTTTSAQTDYVLHVQLIELKQNFLYSPSRVELKLRAQLIQTASNEVIATKQINIIKSALCRNPYSGVIAANEATANALTEIANFCVVSLKNR